MNQDLRALADEAFVFAFPLYEMARMRTASSPRKLPGLGFAGDGPHSTQRWCNAFTHSRQLLTAGGSRVVTPNNDTLYSNAWLDLAHGPLVIDVPATAGRYYVLGLLDFWTNPFAHLGSRLYGTDAGSFVVSGPGWQGELPPELAGMRHVQSSTRWVWIIGRWLVDGAADCPAVHALQDQLTLTPLAHWLRGERGGAQQRFDAGFDPKEPLTGAHFLTQANAALADCPLHGQEAALLQSFRPTGLAAGNGPNTQTETIEPWQPVVESGLKRLRATGMSAKPQGGWMQPPVLGTHFGAEYLRRAMVAMKYIGALESKEAHYPMAWHDAAGQPLSGERAYTLHFGPGELPPVNGFWSITMYSQQDFMLVPNAIERYAIGDRTPGLHRGADGSLTLYIQHAQPRSQAASANWLPAPSGPFYLCLRAYLPKPELLDGRYTVPPLQTLPEPA